MSKTEIICVAILLSMLTWGAIAFPPPATSWMQVDEDPQGGLKPVSRNYVLNYTVTAQDETMGTYTMNVAIYSDQQACLNLSRAINRERPYYVIGGREFRLMYAACNATNPMSMEQRAAANYALREALPSMHKGRL